jgi:hypothetical protein
MIIHQRNFELPHWERHWAPGGGGCAHAAHRPPPRGGGGGGGGVPGDGPLASRGCQLKSFKNLGYQN